MAELQEDYVDDFEEDEDEDEVEEDEEMEADTLSRGDVVYTRLVQEDERVTVDFLTETEMAYLLSERTDQIETWNKDMNGIKHYAVGDVKGKSPRQLAAMELLQNRCPLNIKRRLNDNSVEVVSPNELTKLSGQLEHLRSLLE